MTKAYITITGCSFIYGTDFIKPDMEIILSKDTDNRYDNEAIKAAIPGLKCIGYVANSVGTVIGDSMSAGRLYDKIPNTARATTLYVLKDSIIAEVNPKDLTWETSELMNKGLKNRGNLET